MSIPVLKTAAKQESELLTELVKILMSVDDKCPLAKLNESSISDNRGGRIEL